METSDVTGHGRDPSSEPDAESTQPGVRRELSRVIIGVAALDALTIAMSAGLAYRLKFGFGAEPSDTLDQVTGVLALDLGWLVPVWVACLVLQDAYSRRQFARGTDEFKTLLTGSATAAALISVVAYLVNYDMSRGYYLYAFLIGTTLLLLERYVVRRAIQRARADGRLMHRVVSIGSATSISELDRVLRKNPGLGYRVVAACVLGPDEGMLDESIQRVESLDEPVDVCRRMQADTLVVTGGSYGSSVELRRIGWRLDGTDVDLIVVPSLIDVAGPRIHTRPVAGLPLMHIEPPQVARAMKWGKAFFDRIGSLLLITALVPVLVTVSIAVAVESRGPVFYRHRRIGVRGREFDVWKFRSMVADADARQSELRSDREARLFKLESDPRITRVGAFIRRYSLDELPQLFNVLLGDMSLVGPRPQVADEVAEYDDSAHRRLLVRPGMTGLWQVSGRSHLDWDEAVRLDLYYIDNWSMTGDLVILAKTVRAVLRHEGAY